MSHFRPLLRSQDATFFTAVTFFSAHPFSGSPWTAPITFSMLLNTFLYLLVSIVLGSREASWTSVQVKYKLESLYFALFGPVSLCVTIIGTIWAKYAKRPNENFDFLSLVWIIAMICVHLKISIFAYERFEIWWDFYKNGPLEAVPYHPNRNYNGIEGELMENEEIEEDQIKGMNAALLQGNCKKEKQAVPLKNTMREKVCPICYVDFEIGEKVVDVPNCLHTFHEECVAAWFEKSYTCPMCRGTVRRIEQRGNIQQDLEIGPEV